MQTLRENPFLGLQPYGEKDQLYGRDRDLFLMTDRIFCARTTLLFAGSGVGKTSFIKAKIIPELNPQYAAIIYHKEWAIGQPLENLLQSIAERLPVVDASPAVAVAAGPNTSPVKAPLFDVNNKLACQLKRFISEEPGSDDTNRCLLILDQFEEVFQYHRGKKHFETFINQLATLITYKHCNVRVLFSMREEFLGELSIFDNKIPDLFSNYYRLKSPSKHDAKNIIARTCNHVDMAVDEKQVVTLVGELASIEKTEVTTTTGQNGNEPAQDLEIVAPPYLQIACRRLWDQQFNSVNGSKPPATEPQEEKFLSRYEHGNARAMLKSFCEEILNAFNSRDRALLAEAFNFLVTKRGAKMAYALSSLADHMGVKENQLEPILHHLSEQNSRILRESKGPDNALWYELYHDMYGKIIDEWRSAYRLHQKKELQQKLIFATGIIVVITFIGIWTWKWFDQRQHRQATLRTGDLSKQLSYLKSKQAFDDLKGTWHAGRNAKELWGDAWKRRAAFAERTEDGQQSFLSLLKAAEAYPQDKEDPALLSEIKSYLDSDEYQPLVASYRLKIGVTTSPAFKPILTADGKTLVSIGTDRQVYFWDTGSYQLKHKSLQLAVEGSNQSNFYGAGSPTLSQHSQNQILASGTEIQSATENLIGGIDNNKFCIWLAETGLKLWESDSRSGPKLQTSKPSIMGSFSSYYDVRQPVEQASLSFSSSGRYFATWNGSDSFLLYRLNSDNSAELLLADLMRTVTKMQFSPDGHKVALVFKDGTAQFRDLDTNESRTLGIDGKSIRRIIFSPDGSRFLADMGDTKPAEIVSTASGSMIKRTSATMGDQFFYSDNKTIGSIRPLDQFNRAIIGIRFCDSETGAITIRAIKLDERVEYIINPNGESLLTIGVSGIARLWSLKPPAANSNNLITDSSRIEVSEISDDGNVLVTVNSNQDMTVWDAVNLKKLRGFSLPGAATPNRGDGFPAPQGFVDQLVVSKTGKYVCLKTRTYDFSLRELQDNKEITSGRFDNNPFVRAAAFSPNQDVFAVADHRESITLWKDLDSTTPTSKSLEVQEFVYSLIFSPDGKYLATIGGERFSPRYIRIFEVESGTEMPRPTEGFSAVIALGRNGMIIGTIANDDTAVLVLNLAKGQYKKLWHDTSVTAVALNYNASYAITSTSNGTLQLWETATGRPIATGTCGTRIRTLTISDDGRTVVALSDKWLHVHSINQQAPYSTGEDALSYVDGREIASWESVRILDPSGRRLRNLVPVVQDSLKVELFDFSSKPTGTDTIGPAASLFSIWSKKLALDFDQNGRVSPTDLDSSNPSPVPPTTP
jgi:WD40 repeat protein